MGRGGDRLSELPDDLLRRILHFAPLKQAASTTALSRRWRAPLWPSSGADCGRFFSAAREALDAANVRVTRLTLRLDSQSTILVDVVLSHRAARRVKELRLVAKDPSDYYPKYLYTLTVDSLPLKTLRVLQLTNCNGFLYKTEAAALVLPRLSSLRLSRCSHHLSSLQRFIDAAPALAAIRLDHVIIDATDKDDANLPLSPTTRRFVCPAATVLVLDSCTWEEKNRQSYTYRHSSGYYHTITVDVLGVEINAPRLRRFKYKGPLRSFSFSTRPRELEQVDLDFSSRDYNSKNKDSDPDRDLEHL
ncbi:hypothetical protein ACQ4PT_022188 [Festuca glaucescens]